MKPTGVHLLLTYKCNFECDHCFVWGGPHQEGTMRLAQIREILEQSKQLGTVEWVYFEGGEPFLYHAVLSEAVRLANQLGFRVGVVSNGYWATGVEDAMECLRPMAGLLQDLSISSDLFHAEESPSRQARNAEEAATKLGIPVEFISVARPELDNTASAVGQTPAEACTVMYRGRAAVKLGAAAAKTPWNRHTACPFENLRKPERVHVDPLGNVHLCQGISIGNVFRSSLERVCTAYSPEQHAIVEPLLLGGPAELVRRFELRHEPLYADACHLCYEARRSLRERFPEILAPDQVYGELSALPSPN
jgi:MoaA/NifB/PqqE/SkfB family radical SAM enzyme